MQKQRIQQKQNLTNYTGNKHAKQCRRNIYQIDDYNQLAVKTMQSRPMDMKHEEVAMEG